MKPTIKRRLRKVIAPFRRIGIKKNFTIISNNCWGGITYDKFGKKYTSPTIGCFFKPSDYLKFLTNLSHYLMISPVLIENEQRKGNKYQGLYPAKLDDIIIYFIHYSNGEDVKKG